MSEGSNGKQYAEAAKKAAKALNDAIEAATEAGMKVEVSQSDSDSAKGSFPRVTVRVFAEVT